MNGSKANGNGTQPNKTEINIAECIIPKSPNRRKSRGALVKATGINPKGMHACHLCPNDSHHGGCINPAHLYWGTPSQNRHDHYQTDRGKQTKHKLSEAFSGQQRSEETKRKTSDSLLGKKRSPFTEEHKQKMREAWERRRSKGK